MNDFNRASGLILNSHTVHQGETAEQFEERIDRARYDLAKAEHDRHEAAIRAHVERQTGPSLRANEQFQAMQAGSAKEVISSESVGAILTKAEIERTPVKVFGSMEVSYHQARDMRDVGQITEAEFKKAVVDGLAARGYAAPESFS